MISIKFQNESSRRLRAALLASTALALGATFPAVGPARAQDASWLASPGSNVFNTGANWDTGSVPTGTAFFGASGTTSLSFSFFGGSRTLDGWTFNAGAADYTFTTNNNTSLTFTGAGIVINGGSAIITNNHWLTFQNTSTAGSATINNNTGLGLLQFANSSSASTAVINNADSLEFYNTSTAGSATIANTGTLNFYADSSAGNATIANQNLTYFNGYSTAGNATITNNGGISFQNFSTASNATITNNGGLTFRDNSTAGGAAIINTGSVDFSSTTGLNGDNKISAGSIAGAGNYILGANELTVGGNNLSTEVSGTISGTGGSLVKVGTGTLTLSGANTYTGGTTISGGTLQLGSAGAVSSILGTVTVGSSGAFNVVNADTSGITSIINGGLLNFRNTSTAGSAIITNNQFLGFQNLSSAGTATITNNAGATIEFRDSSTAGSAAITVADGTLNFTNTSSAGSATINLSNVGFTTSYFRDNSTAANATINISSNDSLWFYNQSTAANATIVNNGGLITWNNATFGNATITNNQGLYLEDSSSAGNSTITNNRWMYFYYSSTAESATIVNNYSLNFWGDSSAGNAHITNAATGTLEIVNSSTLANATVINNGQMNFWGGNPGDIPTAGNATITNNAGATMELRNNATTGSATVTNAGAITFKASSTAGTATITNNSGGTIEFYDTSTAGSASITNNNELTFYSNTTAGNAVITNYGTVLFDGNSTAGSAQLINSASSAVVNFFTPGPASDGRITAGSLAGGGRFDLNSIELTVGSNNLSTEVTGMLTGDGLVTGTSLIKTGTGTLTLSGTNTYTGATTVDGGTLLVTGSIASSPLVLVNPGATLGGTGTVATTFLDSGATLAPGTPGSIGTLTVQGNLTFCNCSIYAVKVSPTGADKTVVTGQAALGGTVQATALAGSFRGQTYTILNATGGLGGTQFAGLTFSGSSISPGARNPHLTYDLNNVYLVLDPGTLQLSPGANGNQSSVAGGINSAVLNGGTPPAGFDALLNMGGSQLTNALNQVSGQPGAAGTQSAFDAMQQFTTLLLDPSAHVVGSEPGVSAFAEETAGALGTDTRDAYAAVTPRDRRAGVFAERWGIWASGYGGASTVSGNAAAGTSTTTSRVYGTVVGAERRLSPDTRVGFALGGAGFSFSLADGLGGGRADLFQAGLYGRHVAGPAYVSASLAYGWQDVTTDRTVTVAGTDALTANFKASTFAARAEAGWRFAPWPAGAFGVTPYAAAQVTSFRLPGYSETASSGSGQFALSYSAETTTNLRTELGARLDLGMPVTDGLLTLRGRLAWAHDSSTDRPVTAAFQALPGATFTVNGAEPAADSALVSAGAEVKWLNGISLAGSFEGEFSSTTRSYAGKGTVRYAW